MRQRTMGADERQDRPRRSSFSHVDPMSMTRLDGLHEDARGRFDAQGMDLLKSVITFREPPRQPRQSFEPDIFKARALTDQDIVIRVRTRRLE